MRRKCRCQPLISSSAKISRVDFHFLTTRVRQPVHSQRCTSNALHRYEKMRLDKFLQVSRLVKRRTVANTLCSRGKVYVNGHPAKAGKELAVGDIIRLPAPERALPALNAPERDAVEPEYEVLEIPAGNVSRARATTLYRIRQ